MDYYLSMQELKEPRKGWVSLWRHFLDRERTAAELTASMIEWQEKWNWSFLKLNPAACYHALDWDAQYQFFSDGFTEPVLTRPVIEHPDDVKRIGPIDVHRGTLGDQLQVIRNLRSHFGPDLPMVETIFSPIEIAHRLMRGRQELLALKTKSPDALHALLQQISETFLQFALACMEAGADGIFYATKWATSDLLSWPDFSEFGKSYDLPLLRKLEEENALTVLHVCGERTYLQQMLDYPCDIISYDFFADGVPDPASIAERTGKFVLGGIDPGKLKSHPEEVIQDCAKFREIPRWLAGPSCVITVDTKDSEIRRLRDSLSTSSLSG